MPHLCVKFDIELILFTNYFFDKVLKKILPDEKKDDDYLSSINFYLRFKCLDIYNHFHLFPATTKK